MSLGRNAICQTEIKPSSDPILAIFKYFSTSFTLIYTMEGSYRPLPANAPSQDPSTPWRGSRPSNQPPSPPHQHEMMEKSTPRFRGLPARRRSRPKLWLGVLGKWLITVVFIIIIYVILISYSSYEVISNKQKRYFNALITGFLIALGLTTMSQLTNAVSDLRWWILSRRPRSAGKVSSGTCSGREDLLIPLFRSRQFFMLLV